ncbi:MAG: 1-acyl-sn-glycerol-3-phosphate acyltransferase [Halioglobus sp.]|jgi:1-acyl-sn-glycerol-3-phosphate acyltransferase
MATFDKDSDPLADEAALAEHIQLAMGVTKPTGLDARLHYQVVKRLFRPMVMGAENIPDAPCLFVGNHSLFALDGLVIAPIFMNELQRFPRAMGDKFLFANRPIADFLMKTGAVMGHPKVCTALMKDGQDLLVFPGGAHEAVKPASEMYELQWKERYGFVKLAAANGYTIMPFGLVGPDEFYSHFMEGQDIPDSGLGRVLTRMGVLNDDFRSDILPPIPLGSLGTPFPKPQRCYLGFGEPVDLSQHQGQTLKKTQLQSIRAEVAEQIEMQLTELLFTREQTKGNDSLLRRFLSL